jgi:hypothetical protein
VEGGGGSGKANAQRQALKPEKEKTRAQVIWAVSRTGIVRAVRGGFDGAYERL